MNKILFKQDLKTKTWFSVELRLENGRFTISGNEGIILTRTQARKEALEHWRSYFEESPEALVEFQKKYHKYTPDTAAAYVLECDGEFHGLDVYNEEENKVYIMQGTSRNEIKQWFPELEWTLKWHLNDMKAECEHQEARGETWATHPNNECPDCGYRLGTSWKKRELPSEIYQLFR